MSKVTMMVTIILFAWALLFVVVSAVFQSVLIAVYAIFLLLCAIWVSSD